jgi:hypothetical protein
MDEPVLAESDIAHEVLEQTADYLIRGQRFAGLPDEAVTTGWILAMTKWAQALTDARLAVDDYSVELRLRSIEPPFDKVEAELCEVIQRERLFFVKERLAKLLLQPFASRRIASSPGPRSASARVDGEDARHPDQREPHSEDPHQPTDDVEPDEQPNSQRVARLHFDLGKDAINDQRRHQEQEPQFRHP